MIDTRGEGERDEKREEEQEEGGKEEERGPGGV